MGVCRLQSEMFAVWAVSRQQGLLFPSVFVVLMGCPLCLATHPSAHLSDGLLKGLLPHSVRQGVPGCLLTLPRENRGK